MKHKNASKNPADGRQSEAHECISQSTVGGEIAKE